MIIFEPGGSKNLVLIILVVLFLGIIAWQWIERDPFSSIDGKNYFAYQLEDGTKESVEAFQNVRDNFDQGKESISDAGDEILKQEKQNQLIDEAKKYLEKKANDKTIDVPQTEEECLERGGSWGMLGLSEKCLLATTDAGLECSDGNECQGDCIGVVPEDYDGATSIEATGTCSDSTPVIGCLSIVEEGKINGIICFD